MLHKNIPVAATYADILASKGIVLTLPPQSALSSLLTYSSPDHPKQTMSVQEFSEQIEFATTMTGATSEYDSAIETMVSELEPLVKDHIATARLVGAEAKSYAEKVAQYAAAYSPEDPSSDFNIVKDDFGPIFDDSSVLVNLHEAGSLVTSFNPKRLVHACRGYDAIQKMLMVGSERTNEALNSTIVQFGNDFLENIWDGLFCNVSDPNQPYTLSNIRRLPAGERCTVAYIGYLLAIHLYSEVPSDSIGTLNEFQKNCADLRDTLLSVTKTALAERENLIAQKTLVLSYNGHSKTVVVNGTLYREWIENGGSPNIILGALLSGGRAYSVNDIMANASTFMDQWVAYCAFHSSEADLKEVRNLRSLYTVVMVEQMSEVLPFEKDFREANRSHAENVIAETSKLVNASSLSDLRCFDDMALKLVAGLRFKYTPAKMILSEICEVTKNVEGVDIREAALVAACHYVALYLTGQIAVGRV